MAVKGSPPTGPRPAGSHARPTGKGAARAAPGRRPRAARKPVPGRPTTLESGEEEERVGVERHRVAELEEEGRRHASHDVETERTRREELEEERRVARVGGEDEHARKDRRRRREDEDEDGEEAKDRADEARARGLGSEDAAGRYFSDVPEDRLGDVALSDPNEMKRVLGPSVRFAQHAMLLAQHRIEQDLSRPEALAYLASLYVRLDDRPYARKALREFGPATGILDLYPLEVFDHLLEFVPGFFDRVGRGRLFIRTEPQQVIEATVGKPIELQYDEAVRIRGFAIKDGARPGYLFEPLDRPGAHQLVFLTEGRFTALFSGITRDGGLVLDELEIDVQKSDGADGVELAGLERERAFERTEAPSNDRDEADKGDLKIHFPRRI